MVINITGSESVQKELQIKYPHIKAVCFCEAMCTGDVAGELFSEEFITSRAQTHRVSIEEYLEKMQPFLQTDFFKYHIINLYFDYDMFCAANAITVLAFLEEINYTNKIIFHTVRHDGTANVICSFNIKPDGFNDIFNSVIKKKKAEFTGIAQFDNNIKLYLDFQSGGVIERYINSKLESDDVKIIIDIIKNFPEYGLSDIIIKEIIEKKRKQLTLIK